MNDAYNEEPLSNLSDSSFVILGQGSLPNISNGESQSIASELNEQISKQKNSLSISNMNKSVNQDLIQSAYSDASSFNDGNVIEKLNQVLKENFQLKETLTQNNLAIKSQLNTFFMWQQEVLKTHENHKQKFLETKDLILKLRAENANLKKYVDERTGNLSLKSCEDMNKSTTAIDAASNELKMKQKEIDNLNEQIKKLEEMNNDLRIQNEKLVFEKSQLKKSLKTMESDILKLNKEVEDVARENAFLKSKNSECEKNSMGSFPQSLLPNFEARTQISNLIKQLEDERKKVSTLKEELEILKSQTYISETKLSTTEQLNQCVDKLNDMSNSFNKQSDRINSISSWVSLAEENLNATKKQTTDGSVNFLIMSEIEQLKSHLCLEENVFKEKQETLQEIQAQFQTLLKDYKALQQKLSSLEADSLSIQKYKEEIATLSSSVKSKDDELLSKQQECDKMKEDIRKLNLECEEVGILRVQVQVYQTDFNDERAAREKLVTEREELAEQIRLLENKIQDLERESKSGSGSAESSPSRAEVKKSRYVCPKCMFAFSTLERCQEHVDECLNIHFYPQ